MSNADDPEADLQIDLLYSVSESSTTSTRHLHLAWNIRAETSPGSRSRCARSSVISLLVTGHARSTGGAAIGATGSAGRVVGPETLVDIRRLRVTSEQWRPGTGVGTPAGWLSRVLWRLLRCSESTTPPTHVSRHSGTACLWWSH